MRAQRKYLLLFLLIFAICLGGFLTHISKDDATVKKYSQGVSKQEETSFKSKESLDFEEQTKEKKTAKKILHTKEPMQEGIVKAAEDLINRLIDSELSEVERNRIEHVLGADQDKEIDKEVRIMLEDGLMDLSEQNETGTERLTSAMRIAGLRSDDISTTNLIHICEHSDASEDVRIAGYEALGYIGTEQAVDYLRKALSKEQDEFVLSQIVLSIGTAKDTESSSKLIAYLDSSDPDLRNSAIIALTSMKI